MPRAQRGNRIYTVITISVLYLGKDGHVQVTIKTATLEYARPMIKIVLLPTDAKEDNK